jgi:hypothetical protein
MDASPSPSPADGPESENPPRAGALRSSLDQWQVRLLPVMVGVLIGLAAFFFIATLAQMAYLERSISDVPSVILPPLSASDEALEATGANAAISARQLEILAAMEAYLVERRYHQASVLLMAGLWTRYLGFITGMVLALVGASFILGKLEGPPSELEGKGAGIEGSLKTASPGIILATIVNRDTYETRDVSVYLPSWGAAGISQGPPAAPTFIPLETPAAPTSPVQ